MGHEFPQDFIFGAATAAYQIEGAVNEDGRGESIWDRFSHITGKIKNNDNGDVACDHYHRVDEDIALMKNLGLGAYRFSIAWPRIIPDGDGAINPKGLDFYSLLVDKLLAAGIRPFVTLYHWDLPQSLEDRFGGWRSRVTSEAFGRYTGIIAKHLGDRVKNWITINEPPCILSGYRIGDHAPGAKEPPAVVNQVQHNLLRAHGLAVMAIRQAGHHDTRVGIAHNPSSRVPVIENEANIRAAEKSYRDSSSHLMDPLISGKYPEQWLKKVGSDAPRVEPGDMETINQPLDFFGLNVYTGAFIEAADNETGYRLLPYTPTYPAGFVPWLRHVPQALYWNVRFLQTLYGCQSIFISENGYAVADEVKDGEVIDLDRVHYYRMYMQSMARAVREGYPVKGYFAWSLFDNLEWAEGYGPRFGLHYVDFKTLKRTPKLSARFYAACIKNRRVV